MTTNTQQQPFSVDNSGGFLHSRDVNRYKDNLEKLKKTSHAEYEQARIYSLKEIIDKLEKEIYKTLYKVITDESFLSSSPNGCSLSTLILREASIKSNLPSSFCLIVNADDVGLVDDFKDWSFNLNLSALVNDFYNSLTRCYRFYGLTSLRIAGDHADPAINLGNTATVANKNNFKALLGDTPSLTPFYKAIPNTRDLFLRYLEGLSSGEVKPNRQPIVLTSPTIESTIRQPRSERISEDADINTGVLKVTTASQMFTGQQENVTGVMKPFDSLSADVFITRTYEIRKVYSTLGCNTAKLGRLIDVPLSLYVTQENLYEPSTSTARYTVDKPCARIPAITQKAHTVFSMVDHSTYVRSTSLAKYAFSFENSRTLSNILTKLYTQDSLYLISTNLTPVDAEDMMKHTKVVDSSCVRSLQFKRKLSGCVDLTYFMFDYQAYADEFLFNTTTNTKYEKGAFDRLELKRDIHVVKAPKNTFNTIRNSNNTDGRLLNYTFDVTLEKPSFLCLDREVPKLGQYSTHFSKNNPLIFLGVEYEGAVDTNKISFSDFIKECSNTALGNHGVFKADMSTGDYGFEFVTVPATLSYHKEAFKKWFARSDGVYKKMKTTYKHGIHVHVGREVFTRSSLAKTIAFMNKKENDTFIQNIAGRSETSYCHKVNMEGVDEKKVTKDGTVIDTSTKIFKRLFEGSSKYKNHITKKDWRNIEVQSSNFPRGRLNFGKKYAKTLEFRLFASTTDQVEFFAKLEFVDAVVRFCNSNMAFYNNLTYEAFIDWFLHPLHRKRYYYLSKLMYNLGYLDRKRSFNPSSKKVNFIYSKALGVKKVGSKLKAGRQP